MKTLPGKYKALIAVNLAAIIFGSKSLYGKLDVSPLWIVETRAAFAAIALILFAAIKGKFFFPNRTLFAPFIITGILLSIHWLILFASVKLAGIAITTLTFATFPLFTVIIGIIQYKQRFNFIELAATLCIILGVYLLEDMRYNGAGKIIGTVIGVVSSICFAYLGIISKNLSKKVMPIFIQLYQNIIVSIIFLPLLTVAGKVPETLNKWMWLFMLGVFTTALSHQLYFYSLKKLSAATCSGFVALEPIYAIIYASILFNEPITLRVAISALLIVFSSITLLIIEERS